MKMLLERKRSNFFADVEISRAVEYACEDSDITYLLYKKLSYLSRDKKFLSIYRDIEIKLMLIIAEMEYIGVSVNKEELNKTI